MHIKKSTILLSIIILTSSAIKPSIALAAEISQSDRSNSSSSIPQAVTSEDIASGTFGTAPWRIDSQGVLHIEAGNFPYSPLQSPWIDFKDEIKKISFDGLVIAGARSNYLFQGLSNVVSFENMSNFDLSEVNGAQQMFEGCSSLIELDLSQTGANFLANEYIFSGCTSLEKLNVSGVKFNINAANIFNGDSSLSQLTVDESFGFVRGDLQHLPTPTGTGYTGKWINIGGGTIENPMGESILTSAELAGTTIKKVADTYVWQRAVPAGIVTLHYVDQYGNAIPGQDDTTIIGFNEGDTIPFTDYTRSIPGYTLDMNNQPDPTAKFTTIPQTYNIPYTRNQGNAVNVRYVDENGSSISGYDTQITGFENETKSTALYKINIPGYTLDETKLPASEVTLTATAQPDIVYIYKQNPGSITLRYQDDQGREIIKGQILEDDVSTPFNAEDYKLNIPNYYLTGLPTNVTQFTSAPQTAVYNYAIDQTSIKAHDKLIYLGDDWKPEDSFDFITSEDGTKITILPSDMIVEGQVDTSKVGDYTITYKWTNLKTNKKVSKNIIVHVLDKSAILVHDSTLTVGDKWTAQDNFDGAIDTKGNKIDFEQINVAGLVDTTKAGIYEVTYSYDGTSTPRILKSEIVATHQGTTIVTATITVKEKEPVHPNNPEEPTDPKTPSYSNVSGDVINNDTSRNTAVNISNIEDVNKSSKKVLPDTGVKNSLNLIAIGVLMILSLIALIFFRERKQKRD